MPRLFVATKLLRKLCLESYTLDVSDSDKIYSLESQLDEDVFDCCLKIRRLLPSANTSLAPSLLLESDNSITPQIEKELQGVPDTSLVNATSSTLENTNSHSNETQTLTSDSQSSHDSIDTCEIPLLLVVTDEPSTHPSCEATYSLIVVQKLSTLGPHLLHCRLDIQPTNSAYRSSLVVLQISLTSMVLILCSTAHLIPCSTDRFKRL